jgi:hypothetical protein
VEGSRHPSDAGSEFHELRGRADGPDPDSSVDPPAVARLRELDAPADAASIEHSVPTWSRLVWAGGALVLAGGIVTTTLLLSPPRPDATLHPTGAAVDNPMLLVGGIEASTLRGYGSYLGLEIYSGVNAFESPCLVAVTRASGTLSEYRCAPAPADLVMDVSSSGDGFEGFEGRAGDGIIRFMLRGDTVDAYVYLIPEAD